MKVKQFYQAYREKAVVPCPQTFQGAPYQLSLLNGRSSFLFYLRHYKCS